MIISQRKYGTRDNNPKGLTGRRFRASDPIRFPHLKSVIQDLMTSHKKRDVEDVVRMKILYLMATLFFSK